MASFHSVMTLTSSSKAANENERLVTLHYKGKTEKQKDGTVKTIPKFPSLCVSVPRLQLNIAGMPTAAAAVTVSLWDALQDDTIKKLIDDKRKKDNPSETAKHSINSDECDIAAVVQFANATGNGKLTGEAIGAWFDSIITEPLIERLMTADATRTDEQCAAIVSDFRTRMMKLAAVVPGLPEADYNQLRKAILLAPEDDAQASRLLTKIDNSTVKKEELGNLL